MFPFFGILDYFHLLRVHALDEIVGLDASYGVHDTPERLFDQSSDTSEADRLEAYKQRLKEKKESRKHRYKEEIMEMLDASWGSADFSSKHSGAFGTNPGDNISIPSDTNPDTDGAEPEQRPKA